MKSKIISLFLASILFFAFFPNNLYSDEILREPSYDGKPTKFWIEQLKSKNKSARLNAIFVLGEIEDKSATPHLIEILSEDNNAKVRSYAAAALKKIKDDAAIPALIKALSDKDMAVRHHVVLALGTIGGNPAIKALVKYVKKVKSPRVFDIIEKWGGNEDIVPDLIDILKDIGKNDENVISSLSASRILKKIKSKSSVPILAKLLRDKSNSKLLRISACLAMRWEENIDAIPVLVEMLHDKEEEIRRLCVQILGTIGSKAAIPDLLRALEDKSLEVQVYTAAALDMIGNKKGIDFLLNALQNPRYSKFHDHIFTFVGKVGNKMAIPVLIKLQKNNSELNIGIILALGKIQDESAIPLLVKLTKNKDKDVRVYSAEALGNIKSLKAIDTLVSLLQGKCLVVRMSAIKALGKIWDESAVKALRKTLQNRSGVEQYCIALALSNLRDPSGVKVFIKELKKYNRQHKIRAIIELGKWRVKSATPHIVDNLKDNSENVRNAAANALRDITGLNFGKDTVKWREWWEKNKDRILKEEAEKDLSYP